jgi:hypothetical protein
MTFVKVLLPMLILVVIVLVIYNLLKLYVLDNIKINKWIILAIALVVYIVPIVVWPERMTGVLKYIQTGIFLIFFLWFMDLIGFSSRGKGTPTKREIQKNNVIKAKAKPNRVKNNDIEVIQNNNSKKK